jgi:hypothetical protein
MIRIKPAEAARVKENRKQENLKLQKLFTPCALEYSYVDDRLLCRFFCFA